MVDKVFWEIVPGECCNLKCKGCYAANNNRPDHRTINEKDALIVVRKLVKLGIQKIDILGGEPLLCKFLESAISEFKNLNRSSFAGVVSNGVSLTKERAISLKNAGINQISVSLDGITEETNDWSRGSESFLKIVRGIENAAAVGLDVSISYTITKKNIFETADFIPFAEKLGAKSIGVQIVEKSGRAELNWREIGFEREAGLAAISGMFYQRQKMFVGVSSRARFKEFLNYFFNASLPLEDECCKGGNEEFMVSSGGDFTPCSLYAYGKYPNSIEIKRKNANLISDDIETIAKLIKENYLPFNQSMRTEAARFSTCRGCLHIEKCGPCPLANSSEKVRECEWVKKQSNLLEKAILNSRIKLLIVPIEQDSSIMLPVPNQSTPLRVNISKGKFIEMFGSNKTGMDILNYYINESGASATRNEIKKKVIGFLAKLRSYNIIRLSLFPDSDYFASILTTEF